MGSIQPGRIKKLWILLLAGVLMTQPLFSFGKGDTEEPPMEENQRPGDAPMERPSDPQPPMTGGYSEMDLDSSIVQEAITELIQYLMSSSNDDFELEVFKAESQVVAGHKVRLYYHLNGSKEQKAVVFFPLNKEDKPQVRLTDE